MDCHFIFIAMRFLFSSDSLPNSDSEVLLIDRERFWLANQYPQHMFHDHFYDRQPPWTSAAALSSLEEAAFSSLEEVAFSSLEESAFSSLEEVAPICLQSSKKNFACGEHLNIDKGNSLLEAHSSTRDFFCDFARAVFYADPSCLNITKKSPPAAGILKTSST